MRLHALSVTAFGPFVETVHVDFDELASGGLFLLTGDTGAGKTSVLDAVCFALYGEVPGDRHAARHLRSDHAEPHVEPLVVLEFSIGARTFRFTRSPAWERPKRRGSGTTRVQAHAVVEEQRAGDWVALTNRLDEAGHLVTGLLGMTCTQFTQVAMLPQGRFQAFLRATSTERHAVLQRLFRTRRFEQVEHWLVERRIERRRACQVHQELCAGIVNRLQEAADTGFPAEWDLHDLDTVAADGSLERWAAERLTTATGALEQQRTALETATTALAREQEALDRGRSLAEARTRGEAAHSRLAALETLAPETCELEHSLEIHRRAAPLLPHAMRVETAEADHDAAQQRAAGHVETIVQLLGDDHAAIGLSDLTAASTRVAGELAVAESWIPRESELREQRLRRDELANETLRLAALVTRLQERLDELASQVTRDRAALDQATTAAGRAPGDRADLEAAERGLEAAAEADQLTAELRRARARLVEATTTSQELRQTYLDLREQRISGMAAELAVSLAVGCSCPVCGSVEHPSPAAATGSVGREAEDTAREHYENADFERQAVQEKVSTLTARLRSALVGSSGHTVQHWRATATSAASRATKSAAAERDAAQLSDEVAELQLQEKSVASDLAVARVSLAERTRERDQAALRHDRLAAELDALLAGRLDMASVGALVETLRRTALALDEARAALAARDRAADELARAVAAAESGASEAGFATLAEALTAVLPTAEVVARERTLEERRTTRAACESVLAEEAVLAALAEESPDLTALAARLAEAGRARDQVHASHDHAVLRAHRLEALHDELTEALAAWAPARAEHALAAGLSALVEGKSVDNQLRMRLSAYVLSERLRAVVAAANERLGAMTDQRFSLEQADERGAGEQRGGLSLRVRDEWSGKQRDPATLSGGETFIVSLALALGLADTVSHEAGGTQLDTLFIDEGFGALDATTLDSVMDTLDALRDGGRVVGLVSHVAELRNRVPAQLEVCKARRGSTVRTVVVHH